MTSTIHYMAFGFPLLRGGSTFRVRSGATPDAMLSSLRPEYPLSNALFYCMSPIPRHEEVLGEVTAMVFKTRQDPRASIRTNHRTRDLEATGCNSRRNGATLPDYLGGIPTPQGDSPNRPWMGKWTRNKETQVDGYQYPVPMGPTHSNIIMSQEL